MSGVVNLYYKFFWHTSQDQLLSYTHHRIHTEPNGRRSPPGEIPALASLATPSIGAASQGSKSGHHNNQFNPPYFATAPDSETLVGLLLLGTIVILVLVLQVRELTGQVHAAERQASYWKGQCFQAFDRLDEQQNQNQNSAQNSELWNDTPGAERGVRNPKAQGWRQWRGRGRNMQTSQVPFPIMAEHLARAPPPDRRTWMRR